MNPTPPARLHVILAGEAPLAVVIRRGPAKQVCTILWNRSTDEFTLGQWLKGRLYADRCDLSPYGRYFIYFAYDGRSHREYGPAWTTVSRAPWLKAIALYSKGSTWGSAGPVRVDGQARLGLRPRLALPRDCPAQEPG
jgi:hypothetical protein